MALITNMKNSFLIIILESSVDTQLPMIIFSKRSFKLALKGSGNENLSKAPLVKMSSSDIPHLLKVMNQANDLGDNWVRAAIYEILENAGKHPSQR